MPTEEEIAAQKAADEAKAKEEAAKNQEKKFTQAELNAIVQERLEREKEAQKKENERIALKAKEEEAAKNGEWQKLAQEREEKAHKAELEAVAARAELAAERTKHAAIAEASKAQFGEGNKYKFFDAELAYKLVKADNPELTAEGVTDALKALAKAYPKMLEGVNGQQQNNPGPAKGQRPNAATQQLTVQEKLNQKRGQYSGL